MPPNYFRSRLTELSDDELLLFDVLFDGGMTERMLRRDGFQRRWNSRAHNFTDIELTQTLCQLCDRGLLAATNDNPSPYFHLTPRGGALWECEREPVWARYGTESYRQTLSGQQMIVFRGLSAAVRDHWLELWPPENARRRSWSIRRFENNPLLTWRIFPEIYVGVAVHPSPGNEADYEKAIQKTEQERQKWMTIERERSWWRNVYELQRFLPSAS